MRNKELGGDARAVLYGIIPPINNSYGRDSSEPLPRGGVDGFPLLEPSTWAGEVTS